MKSSGMQNFDDLDIEGRNASHLSEEEREKEESDRKRLMRCSVTAEDGTLRPVYSRTEDADIWCHICNIALFGAHKLHSHNTSSRHKIKLDEWPYPVSLWSKRDSLKSSGSGQVSISDALAPGEPVPPGMEDQMTRATTIQTSLDRHQSSPLVGLEYLLELVDNESCEPSYTCVLCDKRGDPRTVMAHITSYNHRITYLNRHFPTISRAITELPRTQNYKRGANEISVLVAKKIEEKFGRLQPQLVDKGQFEKNKMQYIKNVYQDFHFRETAEVTFMEVYDVRWVTNFDEKMAEVSGETKKDVTTDEKIESKPKKEESNLDKAFPKKIEPDTSKSEFKIRILSKEKLNQKSDNAKKLRPSDDTKSLSSLSSISSSPSPSRSRSRSRSPPPRVTTRDRNRYRSSKSRRSRSRSREPLRERDKWDKFREQIRRAEETLDRALKFHEKNPEKHPSYPDEWKKFWNRRYKELQADGKDPSKHDFKPEWIDFWNKRMREIHNEQLSARKEEIRKRLDLPEDKPPEAKWQPQSQSQPTPSVKRDKVEQQQQPRSSPPKRARHHVADSDDDVEYVGTLKTTKQLEKRPDPYERHREERDYAYSYIRAKPSYRAYYPPQPRIIPRARPHYSYIVKEKSPSPPPKEEPLKEDLEVVGLLRLLTALEGQLGSLGPKVVALLSRALAAEKAKPNSAEELLQDEEVAVLFETVKEKLKGQLFAGMIEKMAVAPTKSAITNIAQLLHKAAEEKKKRVEEEEKRKKEALEIRQQISASFASRSLLMRSIDIPLVKSEPVSVPGVGAVDKVAIAQQIAAALIAQGRTNVSQDELETLINAVVGMAEASKNSDKPITAASFVKSLTAATGTTDAPKARSVTPPPPLSETKQAKQVKEIREVASAAAAAVAAVNPTAAKVVVDPIEAHARRMESLTDNDLKDLLQNFKDLGTDEQHGLINFLKKLEASDPARVEKLRGFVNLGGTSSTRAETPPREEEPKHRTSISPFSTRKGGHNPTDDDHAKWKPQLDMFADDEEELRKKKDENKNKKIDLSDDDDDYSYEDIYKAADKNVVESEKARKHTPDSRSNSSRSWSRSRSKSPKSKDGGGGRGGGGGAKSSDPTAILNETKRLIANIMGDLPNKYVVKSHMNPERREDKALNNKDPAPPGSTSVSIPQSFPAQGYPIPNLQTPQLPPSSQQQHNNPVSYAASTAAAAAIAHNQFGNQFSQQQQSFNNQGYVNPMSMNNGYNNYNPQANYGNMNQGQYGPPSTHPQQTQYPQMYHNQNQNQNQYQQVPGPAPIGYPQQSQYGNYSQQQRFY
ncbi:uncharacterized protein CG7065 [Diachasma alloeum]|uniref:uncharacterized protein CG7065 n=1 Tax=Diachasma alloeum TaxID=454923 RepID=UPI0007384C4D|nr:uncharacterized protein CG7065 [Diachasma alloeum]